MKNLITHKTKLSNAITSIRDKSTVLIYIIIFGLASIGYYTGVYELFCYEGQRFSELIPFSKLWCKREIAKMFKKGFPAVYENMAKMKEEKYFVNSSWKGKPFYFHLLKNKQGIYMITNKITKKKYIGISKDLRGRFYNYMNINRLNSDKTSRIYRALLKYGLENFSVTMLEFHEETERMNSSYLRRREDYFIKLFKPQYNIKRSRFNLDKEKSLDNIDLIIPIKVKNLLDKCLDKELLGYNLLKFEFDQAKKFYHFLAMTPKGPITGNSLGWDTGNIHKDIGFETHKVKKNIISYKYIEICQRKYLNKERLALFYNRQEAFVKKQLTLKNKALKELEK